VIRRFPRHVVALATIGTLLLTACGGSDESDAGAEAETGADGDATAGSELEPLNIGYIKIGAVTDLLVAEEEGFFEDHGLDVTLKELQTADIIPALQSDELDVVLQIPGTAMSASEQGLDLVCVFQNETSNDEPPASNAIMVSAGSDITEIADLEGKTIGVGSLRGQGTAMLKKLLDDNGLSPDDVTLTEVPFAQHPTVLEAGQVDAVVALDPFTTQLVSSGAGEVLSYYMIDALPDQPVGAWWTKREFAESHTPELEAFGAALVDAIEYLQEDEGRGRELIAEHTGIDPALVADMPLIAWKYEVDPDVWTAVAEIMVEQGELQEMPDVESFFSEPLSAYMVAG
jgi:NitT/TauT family transport system substrate-binding protein